MEKSAALVHAIEIAKQFEWHLAINHWFFYGDLAHIIELLRENRPMHDEEARFVAAIVAGEVAHWGARGGPSRNKRERTHERDARVVRPLFTRVLKIKKWQAQRHPEMHIDARSEAREYVSAFFRGQLSPDAVKKIVEQRNPKFFFLTTPEEKAAFAALRERFKKKPDEVL